MMFAFGFLSGILCLSIMIRFNHSAPESWKPVRILYPQPTTKGTVNVPVEEQEMVMEDLLSDDQEI